MTTEAIAVVRAYFAAAHRDEAALLAIVAEDGLIAVPEALPYGGVHRGHEGFRRALAGFAAAWRDVRSEDLALAANGDMVVALSRMVATAAPTGWVVETHVAEAFRIARGKVVAVRPYYFDTAMLLAALRGDGPARDRGERGERAMPLIQPSVADAPEATSPLSAPDGGVADVREAAADGAARREPTSPLTKGCTMPLSAEDRLDILDVLARVNWAADEKDVEATAAFYARDGSITGSFTARAGDDFRADLEKIFIGEGTLKRHTLANPVVEGSGDRATVRWLLVVFEGETDARFVATARVVDEMRKEDGRWFIARHEVSIDPSMRIDVGQNA